MVDISASSSNNWRELAFYREEGPEGSGEPGYLNY